MYVYSVIIVLVLVVVVVVVVVIICGAGEALGAPAHPDRYRTDRAQPGAVAKRGV